MKKYEYYSESFGDVPSSDTLKMIYADVTGLLRGNMTAHLEGKEPLKPKYLKYFRDLRDMIAVTKDNY